jgi:hypothetical protein
VSAEDVAWEQERFLLACAAERMRHKFGLPRGAQYGEDIERGLEVLRESVPELYGPPRGKQ